MACPMVVIAGEIIVVASHSCQTTANQLKIEYPEMNNQLLKLIVTSNIDFSHLRIEKVSKLYVLLCDEQGASA